MSQLIPLDGDWCFAYQPELITGRTPQAPSQYGTTMPVPAYWDDHVDRLAQLPNWRAAKFYEGAKPILFPAGPGLGDAEMPYLIGVGWYRHGFITPPDWQGRTLTLRVGGVALEAWVWLNGRLVGHHNGSSIAFDMALEEYITIGAENELCLAVANTRTDRNGCSIRGYAGQSGGISGSITLQVGGALAIRSLFVYPAADNQTLHWKVEVAGCAGALPGAWQAEWSVRDPATNRILATGTATGHGTISQWPTPVGALEPWSDETPRLYEVGVRILSDGTMQDERRQPFGMRRVQRDGMLLRLNGTPVYLRGATESHYFPLTCTAPLDVATYRERLRILKSLGFNWLRFHTWVPNDAYLQAADELGMLVHVEPPQGAGLDEWRNILRACRTHPAVVIYCCGNEELLDESKIEMLREMQRMQREAVPDALFSPMEALRGVEYHGHEGDLGDDAVPGPITSEHQFNPRRFRLLQEFSDVFASLFYNMEFGWPASHIPWLNRAPSIQGDWRSLGSIWRWLEDDHPHLLHELSLLGTYLDLDLEHRYEGTRIGTALYAATRRHLRDAGVLHHAPLYVRNSSALAALWRKYHVEMARRSPQAQGYDLLGATDFHWHRTGYPCGMLNEFFELKPGETRRAILQYNASSVLLLDHSTRRNLYGGEPFDLELLASHYGPQPIDDAQIVWHLNDDTGQVHARGSLTAPAISSGAITALGRLQFTMPVAATARRVTLVARLSSRHLELDNEWQFWVFPQDAPARLEAAADAGAMARLTGRYPILPTPAAAPELPLRVVSCIDHDTIDFLLRGGRAVLLWQDPQPAVDHTFRPMSSGRPFGDFATVIADHPLMASFPHDGYCSWQFFSLLHHANPPVFNDVDAVFEPIIENVSSYKHVRRQAALYEYRVGAGRLLGCALSLHWDDPATTWFFDELLAYVSSSDFAPRHGIAVDQLRRLVDRATPTTVFTSDQALDPNVADAATL